MRDTFANRFEYALNLRNEKPTDVSKATNISKSSLSEYLKGKYEPKQDKIFLIANYLNVDYGWLMGADTDMKPKLIYNSSRINVYGSIPAGVPLEAVEDIQGWVEIPTEWLKGEKEYIALKIKGDSMYPKYFDGDIVIIQLQPDCESGQDCAVYVNGYDASFKTVYKLDNQIKLQPLNPHYSPLTVSISDDIKILGVAKELRRKV